MNHLLLEMRRRGAGGKKQPYTLTELGLRPEYLFKYIIIKMATK